MEYEIIIGSTASLNVDVSIPNENHYSFVRVKKVQSDTKDIDNIYHTFSSTYVYVLAEALADYYRNSCSVI